MPHFTLQIAPNGPIVLAAVMVSAPRMEMLRSTNLSVPDPQRISALIDTGASISGVDPTVLSALSLTPTGTADVVSTTSGSAGVTVPTYDVCIGIYAAREGDLHFVSDTIQVTAVDMSSRGFKALIGTDVLSKCILHYNGADGFFTLAY